MLAVTRQAVEAAVKKQLPEKPDSNDPLLNEHCGCFVTLKNRGNLRGCIGQFIADRPLIETVSQMAVSAATGDSRFFNDPITIDELENLDIFPDSNHRSLYLLGIYYTCLPGHHRNENACFLCGL